MASIGTAMFRAAACRSWPLYTFSAANFRKDRRLRPLYTFSAANFRNPTLPSGLKVLDVPTVAATNESLAEVGARIISSADECTTGRGNFEISRWPVPGWRPLDPGTGDEAGTTEGHFDVRWEGDYFIGTNLAVATANNVYLDGLGCLPEHARREDGPSGNGQHIYLWMSDYHPCGAQLFWPMKPMPFTVCLGSRRFGDDIRPEHMRAFHVPAGKGVYFEPGCWHNGVYCRPARAPARFLTRQSRVHARISCSWAEEFHTLLRVPLAPR